MHKLLATVLIVTALAVSLPAAAHSEQHFDTINYTTWWTDAHGGTVSPGARDKGQRTCALRNGP